ncbi:MAG: radical SAM family heme chaperone HemW [Flavobacteriales bacterium]|nr:radical SAM family heme chaperone HemW [Flavobacteriales bacterium]
MAGLYFHIPFCVQACNYCDFHFSTRLKNRSAVVDAMLLEIDQARNTWEGDTFETLYFGGGTPSVLSDADLHRLADAAQSLGHWSMQEWTLEANPEDLSVDRLQSLRSLGVTRLSIGVQSTDDRVLRWMNRAHSAAQAQRAVLDAADAGFEHISVDLIYGVPLGDSREMLDGFERDLDAVLHMPIDHLSSYILTAEPRTVYGHSIAKGLQVEVPGEDVAQQYALLCSTTAQAGYTHYETSNFALNKGSEGVHNSRYWAGSPYLGVGPGAHSFRRGERWWNLSNNPQYVRKMMAGEPISEHEALSDSDRFNESVMTGLRTLRGVDSAQLLRETGVELALQPALKNYHDKGWIVAENGIYRLRPEHWLIGDGVAADLFVVDA